MPSGKRALVTGISGFVGSRLAKRLLDLGYEVYGLVRRRADGKSYARLAELNILNEVRLIEGDLRDLTSLLLALDRTEPEVIFHLAAQSFVHSSFHNPLETFYDNALGTQNLLEAVRLKDLNSKIVFAGTSEEYGLQFISREHYERMLKKYGVVWPPPSRLPELPINEDNPLRPMSPYAVSKVYGEMLMRNYYHSYGIKAVISRAFNHEGAGRGSVFVTAVIARQAVALKEGEADRIVIGNVNAFRDWSHVDDIVGGYIALAEKGAPGDVYVLGSRRTNSVLTYILLALDEVGYRPLELESLAGGKKVKDPLEPSSERFFGVDFEKTKVDAMMLSAELEYTLEDRGLLVKTSRGDVRVEFDPGRFRPADVPILLSDPSKAMDRLGFKVTRPLRDVLRDQIDYYLDPNKRKLDRV